MTGPGFAPAKINLALHVTGRRADGYHLLDSLVAFAGVGDVVTAEPAGGLSLAVTGPEAAGLSSGDDNLVLRAARAFDAPGGARLVLEKHLPQASGIGGGSADAAAALRVLAGLWGRALPDPARVLVLGADVPVCLAGRTTRMGGIGEVLAKAPHLPPVHAVLCNPRQPLETPAVFAALQRRDNPPLPDLPGWRDAVELAGWLGTTRNDLEAAAIAAAPVVARVLDALAAQEGCLLARMSGSGATCFGLFAGAQGAEAAARRIARAEPGWWLRAAPLRP